MEIDIPSGAAFETTDGLFCFHCVKAVNERDFVKVVLIYDDSFDKCSVCQNYLA